MALQNSKIHLRSITIIGAGAAVLAVIGYLIMKSDSRKKSKKKVKTEQNETTTTTTNSSTVQFEINEPGSLINKEVNETDEINKLCDLYSKNTFNLSSSKSPSPSPPPPSETIITKPYINNNNNSLVNDQSVVFKSSCHQNEQNLINEKSTTISQVEYCVECINNNNNTQNTELLNLDLETNNLMNLTIEPSNVVEQTTTTTIIEQVISDKLSETSSDSGNGTSELINIITNEDDIDESEKNCLRSRRRSKISPESNHSISSNGENTINNQSNIIDDSLNTTTTTTTSTTTTNEKIAIPESTSSSTTHPETDIIVYEFHFPRKYCGKLIGRNGVHVDYIRNKTHVQIAVRNDASVDDLQIVCLTGCIGDVDQALDIISARFPYRHYPQISFKPITKPIVYRRNRVENNKVIVSSSMYVQLTTSQTDINVSAIVTPTHLFIQLPSQPTYQLLQRLDEDMLHLYSSSDKAIPNLTCPIEYGTICAAPTSYGWHRAMVTEYFVEKETQQNYPYYNGETEMATVKFLDYGGYLNIPVSQLKQLRFVLRGRFIEEIFVYFFVLFLFRTDYMSLPFQAIEVFLDDVVSIEGKI
jgi:hypothetical protein